MNDIIQSLWIGTELTTLEKLSLASFLANGHEYHLYAYNNIENIPDGVVIEDANSIIPQSEVFAYKNAIYALFGRWLRWHYSMKDVTYSTFSNWFRWELLFRKGGYWVDMDVICLKPFTFMEEILFCMESNNRANPAILRFPKGHEISLFMTNISKSPNTILPFDSFSEKIWKCVRKWLLGNKRNYISWGESGGPVGFTRALKYFGLFDKGKPFTFFYPVHPCNWKCFFDDTFKDNLDFFSGSYAVHFWNDMIRREKDFDKDCSFNKDSVFEKLKAKYL
jgi:hypothetical protein